MRIVICFLWICTRKALFLPFFFFPVRLPNYQFSTVVSRARLKGLFLCESTRERRDLRLKQSKEILCESTLLRKTNSSRGRTLSYDEQWSSDEQSPNSWWKEFWSMACADESSSGFSRCVWDCHERVSRTQCQCYWGTTIYLQRFEEKKTAKPYS